MMDARLHAHETPDAQRYRGLNTRSLRSAFILDGLFQNGETRLYLTDLDRAIVGSAIPTIHPLGLPNTRTLSVDYLCQRRELGVLNIGRPGKVSVDGQEYALDGRDALYIGRGARDIRFSSDDIVDPAIFYLHSYPAHADYPTALITQSQANVVDLGSNDLANKRTINQYIHENGAPSCQLVMGYTELAVGSVWNTMPPHTHDRRTEVYTYFDVPDDQRVLHLMGRPDETRSLWIRNHQTVLSPSWSIHSGVGTAAYRFIWAMGGENQDFNDMDMLAIGDLA
ncbi:5-dehydro-4-deoxy-D-glucuronate isomerase [Mucisphaera calidilacus]|uniref:4-deoxy-L-threo-5-hexosulose-uronate ketol-isomerase n=1 Tax=Mucisphaera calidilacus TaxID=2527982 RepID=A0A518BWU5_9BACT|nr:5-dehydro-4-deoxy-D-glucuronate isomerase [Mucisphaera calidilacus]QDU71450.1 4-deoxy-L-threo-5-hexosulose-uronate ketol-isomerase [Mucisphaera calidilacus]